MCRTGGRRCEAKWDEAHKQRTLAQRRRNRNRQKAEQARAAGDDATAGKYEALEIAAQHDFAHQDAMIRTHEAATDPAPSLEAQVRENQERGTKRLLDVPIAEHMPAPVRERITSEEFQGLLRAERDTEAELARIRAAAAAGEDVSTRDRHDALDAYKAARADTLAYRLETARILDGTAETEDRDFVAPASMQFLGEAESGSVEWHQMRQPTVGGSDVGAICQVGAFGPSNRKQVQDAKMELDPQAQEDTIHTYIGNVWEPHLVAIASQSLGQQAYTNKGTRSDGKAHVNLDAFTLDESTGKVDTVVEIKTSSHDSDWNDAPPEGYVLQAQHYMHNLEARRGVLVAAVNDQRLVIHEIDHDDKVPAGPKTPKMLGDEFAYRDVKAYTENTVATWNDKREKNRAAVAAGEPAPTRPRQRFTLTDDEKATWNQALTKGAVYVDLETTSRSPGSGHIIEFAGIDSDGNEFERTYNIPPEHAKWNGTGAVDVHHITPEMVEDRPVLMRDEPSIQEIREFIGDRVLIAHNASFEASWLKENGIQAKTACTKRAFGALVDDDVPDNTMKSFTEWAGDEYKDAHRAMPDVRMMKGNVEKKLRPLLDGIIRS